MKVIIMKKTLLSGIGALALAFVFSSCGGEALAQEICDCTTAANALPGDDPDRSAEQDKCMQLQKTNWEKVKGDAEQESAFNDRFPCGI